MTEASRPKNDPANRLINITKVPLSDDQRNANFTRTYVLKQKKKGENKKKKEEIAAKKQQKQETGIKGRRKDGRASGDGKKRTKQSGSRHLAAVPSPV